MFNPNDVEKLRRRCQADPMFFSRYILGSGQPWEKQTEIMLSVRDNRRTVVVSGYCVGKTWVAARIVLWFLFCFPRSIVITTAPTARQVENVLWAEIKRQYVDATIPLGGEMLKSMLQLDDGWFAIGLSTDEPTRFQGFHAGHVLIVFDEAAGVDRQMWEAAEGQMAGSHARWLAIGNPTAPSGPFYQAYHNKLWNSIHISCLDSPNVVADKITYPNLVTPEWIQERKLEWGPDSPLFHSKVLGRFPAASEFGLIPLDWIERANARAESGQYQLGEKIIGVDIARFGADRTVLLLREGNLVKDIEVYQNIDTMKTVGRIIKFVQAHQVKWNDVMIDSIGIGSGVVDRLREQHYRGHGVNFGRSIGLHSDFANIRSQSYWDLRSALSPEAKEPLAIAEKYSELTSELTAIEWAPDSSGKIRIEPKEDIKKRLGRSPDYADALALTYSNTAGRILIKAMGLDKEGVILGRLSV